MDIGKAIEKAKRLRREETPPPKTKGSGWVSPDYCQSTCMELDPKKVARNRCVCIFPDGPEIGAYKLLRTQVQHRCRENGWNTLMITSVRPGEGKTLTSINLALALAKELNQTTLLVDCDLKRQAVRRYLGLPSAKGLVNYLVDNQPLKDLIIWPGIQKLTVISGGKTVHGSTELLGSPRMKALVAEMKARYEDRFIVFDVPPILGEADAIAFAPLMDAILIVVEASKTPLQAVGKALELIPNDKLLGFVLNRHKSPADTYYYNKSYYYRRSQASAA